MIRISYILTSPVHEFLLYVTISMFRGIPLSTFNINIYWYETSPIFLNNNYWFNSGLKCLLSQIRQVPAVPTRGKQWWSWHNGNWSSVWKVSICLMPTFPGRKARPWLACMERALCQASCFCLSGSSFLTTWHCCFGHWMFCEIVGWLEIGIASKEDALVVPSAAHKVATKGFSLRPMPHCIEC